MTSALISIVVPTYNRSHLIGETIQSVIAQTFTSWEMIIVDDGSTDNTEEIVNQTGDARIRYFLLPHTGCVGQVTNYGIRKSNGQWIALLDSDDLWKPEKLAFQLSLLSRFPQATFILGNGEEFGQGAILTPEYESLFIGSLFLPVFLREKFCFYAPTWMFKKEILDTIGMFGDQRSNVLHLRLFLRMSSRYTGIFTNDKLIRIRKHDANMTLHDKDQTYLSTLLLISELHNDGTISSSLYRKLMGLYSYKAGIFFLKHHNRPGARHQFLRQIGYRPFFLKGYIRLAQAWLSDKTTAAS